MTSTKWKDSVHPDYIGEQLTFKVNPVDSTAEVFAGSKSIKKIELAALGSREKIITPEDRIAIKALWSKQQERRRKKQKPPKRVEDPEVETRSPAVYDKLAGSGEVA